MRLLPILASLLIASAVPAAPIITSFTPTSGPAGGGTTVTIKGTGFSTCIICSPPTTPEVLFGATPAASVVLVDSTTIVAVTPPHPEGSYPVSVIQFDGASSLPGGFTFIGDFFAALEPILVPVFTPPVRGQFGSDFRTTVSAAHKGSAPRVLLFGLDTSCLLITPVLGPQDARVIEPNGPTVDLTPDCATWPAKLFYVPAELATKVTLNARVRDVSRASMSHGTEIPIVRASEFTTDAIVLLNVPLDGGFRNTLRIYSLDEANVIVTIDGIEHAVSLQRGSNPFEPSYQMFTNFPQVAANSATRVRVTVRPLTPITSPPSPTPRIWAFISMTNNVTQEITTISPD